VDSERSWIDSGSLCVCKIVQQGSRRISILPGLHMSRFFTFEGAIVGQEPCSERRNMTILLAANTSHSTYPIKLHCQLYEGESLPSGHVGVIGARVWMYGEKSSIIQLPRFARRKACKKYNRRVFDLHCYHCQKGTPHPMQWLRVGQFNRSIRHQKFQCIGWEY